MNLADKKYLNLPWKSEGRTVQGVDCVGLVALWLGENYGFQAPVPDERNAGAATELLRGCKFDETKLQRGDVVFFAPRDSDEVKHVGVWLGEGKLLHILRGVASRVD